jgi:hypothetical protein
MKLLVLSLNWNTMLHREAPAADKYGEMSNKTAPTQGKGKSYETNPVFYDVYFSDGCRFCRGGRIGQERSISSSSARWKPPGCASPFS